MTAHPEPDLVAADLAELRRLLDVRTARVDGQLALLAQRSAQYERDADDLQARVTRLESTRWRCRPPPRSRGSRRWWWPCGRHWAGDRRPRSPAGAGQPNRR